MTTLQRYLLLLLEPVIALVMAPIFMGLWNWLCPLPPLTYWQAALIGYSTFYLYFKAIQLGGVAYGFIKAWWEGDL